MLLRIQRKGYKGIATRVNIFFIDLSVDHIEEEIWGLHDAVKKKCVCSDIENLEPK